MALDVDLFTLDLFTSPYVQIVLHSAADISFICRKTAYSNVSSALRSTTNLFSSVTCAMISKFVMLVPPNSFIQMITYILSITMGEIFTMKVFSTFFHMSHLLLL